MVATTLLKHEEPATGRRTANIGVGNRDSGGWDVRVAIDGRVVLAEHYGDWHRVERRRAILEAQFAQPPRSGAQ